MNTKWVFGFHEVDELQRSLNGDWDAVRGLLGGKGANLGDMSRLGIPVPPGFTITTAACNTYGAGDGVMPEGLWDQVLVAIAELESSTGRRFGHPLDPLLVSCRSRAKFSMPGMMDTVLDIGLNDDVVAGMINSGANARSVLDSYRRLLQMFGGVVLGVADEAFEATLAAKRDARRVVSESELSANDLSDIVESFKAIVVRQAVEPFPTEPLVQLRMAIEAVFVSWWGKRAHDYRVADHIPHDLGTAVNVVAMVFGNMAIYAFGLGWLSLLMGANKSVLAVGLYPFIVGDFIKVALAAILLPSGWRLLKFSRRLSGDLSGGQTGG